MANKLQVKRTSVSGRLPNTSDPSNTSYIDAGELAFNLTDKRLFTSNGSAVVEFGTGTPVYDATGSLITNTFMAVSYVNISGLTTNVVPATDNTVTVGTLSYRFAEGFFASDIVVGNSTVNTTIGSTQILLGGSVVANGNTGTVGQVLTSGGAGVNAYWSTASGGGVTTGKSIAMAIVFGG